MGRSIEGKVEALKYYSPLKRVVPSGNKSIERDIIDFLKRIFNQQTEALGQMLATSFQPSNEANRAYFRSKQERSKIRELNMRFLENIYELIILDNFFIKNCLDPKDSMKAVSNSNKEGRKVNVLAFRRAYITIMENFLFAIEEFDEERTQ